MTTPSGAQEHNTRSTCATMSLSGVLVATPPRFPDGRRRRRSGRSRLPASAALVLGASTAGGGGLLRKLPPPSSVAGPKCSVKRRLQVVQPTCPRNRLAADAAKRRSREGRFDHWEGGGRRVAAAISVVISGCFRDARTLLRSGILFHKLRQSLWRLRGSQLICV